MGYPFQGSGGGGDQLTQQPHVADPSDVVYNASTYGVDGVTIETILKEHEAKFDEILASLEAAGVHLSA